jgi:hypothetical protein
MVRKCGIFQRLPTLNQFYRENIIKILCVCSSMIQIVYNIIDTVRVGVGVCLLIVIITPLYIVKYVEDSIYGKPSTECRLKGGTVCGRMLH